MCYHPLHLSLNDVRFLRWLRIPIWACPQCGSEPTTQWKISL